MGILELSRVLFATLFGVIFLNEVMRKNQIVGLVFVSIGLLILPMPAIINKRKGEVGKSKEDVKIIFVVVALISCMLNAVSATLDKYLMSGDLTSGQLQFWYMFFMVVYYGIYVLVKRIKINWLSLLKNYWIWILSILFVLADRALFVANAHPDSKVTIMTLIKQSCCVVSIIGGKLIFKEKNILYKMFCAGIIVAGILLTVLI
jgi:drug/metabolite transporter (DMT)-like permease